MAWPRGGGAEERRGVARGLDRERLYSENFAVPVHGSVIEELSPRLFSFNSPYGACDDCHGIGHLRKFTAERVCLILRCRCMRPWLPGQRKTTPITSRFCIQLAKPLALRSKRPGKSSPRSSRTLLLNGSREPIPDSGRQPLSQERRLHRPFEGILPILSGSCVMPVERPCARSWRNISSWCPVPAAWSTTPCRGPGGAHRSVPDP
jgi:excinuclease UvrABC ATPase subunit